MHPRGFQHLSRARGPQSTRARGGDGKGVTCQALVQSWFLFRVSNSQLSFLQNRRKFDFWGFRNDFFRDTHKTLPHGELDPSNLTFQKCDVNGRPLLDEGSTLGGLDKEAAVDNLRHFRSVTDCKASGLAIIESIVESLFALFKKTPFLLFLGSLVGFCEEAHVTHFHTYARETDALAAESEQFRGGEIGRLGWKVSAQIFSGCVF